MNAFSYTDCLIVTLTRRAEYIVFTFYLISCQVSGCCFQKKRGIFDHILHIFLSCAIQLLCAVVLQYKLLIGKKCFQFSPNKKPFILLLLWLLNLGSTLQTTRFVNQNTEKTNCSCPEGERVGRGKSRAGYCAGTIVYF